MTTLSSSSSPSLEEMEHAEDSDALLSEQEEEPVEVSSPEPSSFGLVMRAWKVICGCWIFMELKKLFKLSIPISLSILFQVSLLWISLLFLGHLPGREGSDSYEYAAAGLGSSFLNVTGISIGHGIASASDTLSSQAFGYKNYKRVGVILQRGILILGLVLLPIVALWLNTESLLLLVQQPPCVARFSALYVEFYSLALPFLFLYILLQHYLQSQSIVWQFVLIGITSNIISVIIHAVTIFGIGLGFKGAVAALVTSNCIPPLLVLGYIYCRKLYKETWGGWSFESLEEWWLYIKLAVPGLFMLVLEWSCFEIITFLAGAFGETILSANVVWFQVLVVLFMPCLGLAIAVSIRVGNELGAGNAQGAKRASYAAVSATLLFSITFSIILLCTKDVLAFAFIPGNKEVAKEVSQLIAYTAWIMLLTDQAQAVLSGVLRGSGRQYIGAIVNFVAYYVIALPIGAVLAFKADLKLLGLWIGMTVGNAFQCFVLLFIVLRTDWEKECTKAMRRAQTSSSDNASTSDIELKARNDESDTSSLNSETSSSGSTGCVCRETDMDNLLSDVELQNKPEEQVYSHQSSIPFRTKWPHKLRKLLLHGSFYVVGASILVAGGISSHFHPHVDPEEYSNCTDFSNSSYFSDSAFS